MTDETQAIEAKIDQSRHALNDTFEALRGKLSPGQIVNEAMGLLQGQAGKFTATLGKKAQDNPVPLLLIAAGAALLLRSKPAPAAIAVADSDLHLSSRLAKARTATKRQEDESDDAWADRLHKAESDALSLKQSAGEEIDAFKQRVKDVAESLSQKTSEIKQSLSSTYEKATDAVTGGAAGLAKFASEQTDHARHTVEDVKHKAQNLYDDNPLAAGALGIAIGALLGSLAPLSSVERNKLQGIAEVAKSKGSDLAKRGALASQAIADKVIAAV